MRGAILPLPNTPSLRGALLSTGTTLHFNNNNNNNNNGKDKVVPVLN
jgi:hypothetical protein